MSTTKVTRNFQVTIPVLVRKTLAIRIGSIVDFVIDKGQVILRPKTLIDEDQAWFWTQEWQAGEKRVSREIREGKTLSFDSVEDMKKHFEK